MFDASGSSASDGSALAYAWDFGEGRHGGGKTIAQAFVTAGAHAVSLTVVDGQNRRATVQHTVTVSAAPPPSRTVTVHGQVDGPGGTGLPGVTVTAAGTSMSATTDALGAVQLDLGVDSAVTLHFEKDGFADQFLALTLPDSVGSDGYFAAALTPRDAPQTLADATAGGTLTGRDGATLVLPPSALVDASGAAVSGPVQVSLTPVDVTAPGAGGFPGQFAGLGTDASLSPIVSMGTTEFVPTRSGARLQLAPGKATTVELPLYANQLLDGTPLTAGTTIPLWSLDEQTGLWVREGDGTVTASASSPTGLAFRAAVSHLSWWNCDVPFPPYFPKPRCVYDTDLDLPGGEDTFATATICNLLGDIDRGGGNPLIGRSARLAQVSSGGNPRLPGYAAKTTIPIEGGRALPVPANVPVDISATALNGTWTGQTVVQGAVGTVEEVLIKMRPIAGGGTGQLITLPYDQTASLDAGQVATYQFDGPADEWVRITASRANGSTLAGTVHLKQGSTDLGSQSFEFVTQPLVRAISAGTRYTIEVAPTSGAPGAFRLQVELQSATIQPASLALPVDTGTVSIPAFTIYRGTLDLPANSGVSMVLQRQSVNGVQWRVRGPAGAPLFDAPVTQPLGESRTAVTTAAGQYAVEVVSLDGQPVNFRLTAQATSWASLPSPGILVSDIYDLIDLVPDHDGKPVLITLHRTTPGGITNQTITLSRWDGTAWAPAASDVGPYPHPCAGGNGWNGVGAVFDAQNRPLVVYGDFDATGTTQLHAVRYENSAWQPVGPNAGAIPNKSTLGRSCFANVAVRIGADGLPLLGYPGDNTVWVEHFDGAQWQGLVTAAGDGFPALAAGLDLQVDPSGRPVLVTSDSAGKTTVQRFKSSPAPAWEGVGPGGGVLPQPASNGGDLGPRLLFDASGNPIVGAMCSVALGGGTFSRGTTVARFDGNQWQGNEGYLVPSGGGADREVDMSFVLYGGEAFMAWVLNLGTHLPVVQRNTPSGWSAVGTGDGRVPQYSPTPLNGDIGATPRMLVSNGELYLALVDRGGVAGPEIRLLRLIH